VFFYVGGFHVLYFSALFQFQYLLTDFQVVSFYPVVDYFGTGTRGTDRALKSVFYPCFFRQVKGGGYGCVCLVVEDNYLYRIFAFRVFSARV
jgi:hypothetical protein